MINTFRSSATDIEKTKFRKGKFNTFLKIIFINNIFFALGQGVKVSVFKGHPILEKGGTIKQMSSMSDLKETQFSIRFLEKGEDF